MSKTQESLELSEKETLLTDSPQHRRHESNGDHVVMTSTSPIEIDEEKQKKSEFGPHRVLPWVLKTFQKRYCLVVVPKPNNEGICECGRPLDCHGVPLSQLTVKTDIKWEASKHTRYEGTNAFGEIEFHGVGRNTRAKYIRLSSDTKPENVINLLLQEWKLDIPKLLISVTGGAKAFKLSPKLKQSFTDGLSKVVQSTGAWVITGGINTGVMKLVGEALQGTQRHGVVCIGIATWGIVNDRKKLTQCGETVKYHITNSFATVGACLDNNHTHFLLADHGIINSYGGEIDFRGTLERYIRKLKYESRSIDGVPGVQLILEGGPNTIRTVYKAISEVPPMPVVLIKGSGRAADLLAYAVSMSYTSGPPIEMEDVTEHTQLIDMIQKAYPEMDSDKWTNIYKDIIDCMQFKDNITVYSLENEGDASIDEAIFTALLNERATRHNSFLPVLLDEKSRRGKSIVMADVSGVLSTLLGMKFCSSEDVMEKKALKKVIFHQVPQRSRYFENPFHELFLWAVICNMMDMAICFWAHGEEALAKSLIAKKLFQELALAADRSHMFEDIVDELQENARIFDDFSIKLLQECSSENNILASRLIAYCLDNWGQESCLSLAVASNQLDFVTHEGCQTFLTSTWTGDLQLHGMQAWKILLCLLCPPGILLLRFGTPIKIAESRNKVSSNSSGIRSIMLDNAYEIEYYQLSIKEKISRFFKAPVTKFWSNVYAYLLFLLLFGFVITTELPEKPFNSEWLLIVMVFTFFTEEIRQIVDTDAMGFVNKIKNWASQYGNICDAIAITLFFVGFVLRMNGATVTGHVIYSIDIIFWIIRLLDIFTVHKQIGPYVVMIEKMTIDTAYFMFLLLVFLVAYGVSRYAILNPKEKRSIATLGKILMIPYFQMYGELFIEYPAANNNETIFATENHFDHIEPLVTVMMSVYLLVVNILLLNLLIAIFNNTYAKVQANSDVIWKYQRYKLLQEYSSRPWAPPPLIIFSHMYSFMKTFISCCQSGTTAFVGRDRRLKYFPSHRELIDLMLFEGKCLKNFLWKRNKNMFVTPDEKLRMIGESVDNITRTMGESKQEYLESSRLQRAALSSIEEKVSGLERIIKVLSKKRHLESDTQNESHVGIIRSNIFPKPRPLSTVNSEEEVETKVPKESVKTETSTTSYPAPEQRLKSPSFASTVVDKDDDVQDRKSNSLPSSPYQTSAAYDNIEAYNTVDGKDINIEFKDTDIHIMSRSSAYPLTNIKRFALPDHLVPWESNMPEYNPPTYTAPMVLASPNWADEEYLGNSNDYTFNGADGNVDRKSSLGIYNIVDGLPRNPKGRTGLQGRGLLGRYGPNHMAEYILTRNRKDALIGNDMIDVLTIGGRALPQDAQFDEQLPDNLQKVFSRETLLSLNFNQQQCEKYMDALKDILDNKQLVYEGYFDNERNTDNAWIETHAFHFHDHRGDVFTKFLLTDKYSHLKLQWVEASLDMNLPDHQMELIEHILKEMDNRDESHV